jgi:hypothetical protein
MQIKSIDIRAKGRSGKLVHKFSHLTIIVKNRPPQRTAEQVLYEPIFIDRHGQEKRMFVRKIRDQPLYQ